MKFTDIKRLETKTEKVSFLPHKSRKKWPLLIFLMSIVAGFLAINSFLLPSFALMHFASTVSSKTNPLNYTFDQRASELLLLKSDNKPTNSKYKLVNQYRHFDENLKANLQQNGFNFQDKKIYFENHSSETTEQKRNLLNSNFNANQAKNNSFGGLRAMFQDQIGNQVAQKLGLNRSGFAKTDQDFAKKENQITKLNSRGQRFNLEETTNDAEKEYDNQNYFNDLKNNLKKINQAVDKIEETEESPIYKPVETIEFLKPNFVQQKSMCGMTNNSLFLKNYAKKEQAVQQARLGMQFLIEADKIKAGDATSSSVNYYNQKLSNAKNKYHKVKSASESSSYRNLAFDQNLPIDSDAERFMLGAGPTVAKTIKDNPSSCQNSSPFNFFNNIINFLNPVTTDLNLSDQEMNFLTEQTQASMANRRVASNLEGESFANAVIPGVKYIMNQNAMSSGSAPLTVTQALTFHKKQEEFIAFYNQTSPFNIKSPYSLIGGIINYFATFSNDFLSNFSTIKTSLLSVLNQKTLADSQILNNFNQCQDPDYLAVNKKLIKTKMATTPDCLPVYGLPVETINISPETVIDSLVASGNLIVLDQTCQNNINCELKTSGRLKEYQEKCVNRKRSLGQDENQNSTGDGSECFLTTNEEKLFPNYFLDQRLQKIFQKVSKYEK